MQRNVFLISLVVWLLAATAPPAAAAEAIGFVKTSSGDAWLERQDGKTAAKVGTAVYLNDTVRTGIDASVGITFKDETRISLGPDTKVTIDEYLYQPREAKLGMVTSLTKGTLQFVSGVITKLAPDTVKVNTPTGTLGVRGTRFLVVVGN